MKKTLHLMLFLLLSLSLVACAAQKDIQAPAIKITEPTKTKKTKVTEPAKTEKPAPPAKDVSTGPIIIGEIEYVTIKPENIRLKARIDTGATTSSIHATQILPSG